MNIKIFKKTVSVILTLNLLLQSYVPFLISPVYADDSTASATTTNFTPTPEPIATPTEAVILTPEITPDTTPTPTLDVTPTVEPILEVIPDTTPSVIATDSAITTILEVTPTVEITPTTSLEISSEPTSSPDSQAPPAIDDQTDNSSDPSTSTTEPAPLPESLTISLNLEQSTVLQPTLITDKPDYFPTDIAYISGTGFSPNTTYVLHVISSDVPYVSYKVEVTSDESGYIFYAYQLDGNYRPNYSVDAIDASGAIVASMTFFDSASSGTIIDADGENDEPGQKDLTQLTYDYTALPSSMQLTWNWDEIAWSGSNTGDACSLFDMDMDGYANYALCVSVSNTPAAFLSKALFSCDDSRSDRCPNSSPIATVNSSCSATISSSDPFPDGDANPSDTQASCSVTMSEVGGTSSKLIDVCSFPSQQPNSDPSDCIVASTESQTGFLEVKKALSPISDSGLFDLQIDGVSYAFDATHNSSTSEKIVAADSHTFGESQGTGTLLSNYTSSVLCKDGNGTGATVATTGTNPWTITVGNNQDVVCTITNTRINDGTITIIKDASPNDAQDFSFTTSGTGLSSFNLDDDADGTLQNTKVFSNLATGTYSVSETAISGWDLTSATCNDGSLVSSIELSSSEDVTCTFVNTKQSPALTIVKTATPSTYDAVSDVISYSYLVTNSGNVTLTGPFTVSDDKSTDESCPVTASLSPAASITCTASYTITQADLDAGSVTNIASASNGTVTSPTDTETVTAVQSPAFTVTKEANKTSVSEAGNTIGYTIKVKNTGNVTLTGVTVDDPLLSNEDCDGTIGAPYISTGLTVNVDTTLTCVGIYTVNQEDDIDTNGGGDGDIDNTVTADSTQTDSATASTSVNIVRAKIIFEELTATNEVGDAHTFTVTVTKSNGGAFVVASGEHVDFTLTNSSGASYDLDESLSTCDNVGPNTDSNGQCTIVFNSDTAGTVTAHASVSVTIDGITLARETGDTFGSSADAVKTYIAGSVSGYKWNDLNGNSERDCSSDGEEDPETCEDKLAAWRIFIDEKENETYDTGEIFQDTDSSGNYQFNNLHSGIYTICEVPQVGWTNTYPVETVCQTVEISEGEDLSNTNFGNQRLDPRLVISRSNNAASALSPGSTVEHTIVMKIYDNDVSDLKLTDLLPKGFAFRVGSYSVLKDAIDITPSIPAPSYNSPGLWNLGDFHKNEVITIKYLADVSSDVQPGIYDDLAWAVASDAYDQGQSFFATGENSEYVEGNFVGTDVEVVKDQSRSDDYNVEKKEEKLGQVLGASTSLPATGANELWLIASLLSLYFGIKLVRSSKSK